MKKKEKILVAMSGGVDSSVVATLLVEQDYDVTGMFAVNYDTEGTDDADFYVDDANHADNTNTKVSCWRPDYQDALRVAAHLGIPLLRWDFQKEYKKMVLDYMYKEYEAGRTPNPDVMCNKFVKFGVWLDKAKKMGFDKIATGHYANIQITNDMNLRITNYELRMAKDENKDQTYFLHQLNQEQLSQVLFPLGEYTKPEVRELAKKFKLPTANKEESMGICFVGEVPMKEFLENKINDKIKGGDIVLSSGEKIGKHDGLAFYTIGQRHGFSSSREGARATTRDLSKNIIKQTTPACSISKNIASERFFTPTSVEVRSEPDKPLYVVDKDFDKNQLIVGYEDDPLLYKKEIIVYNIHWISDFIRRSLSEGEPLKCKVRLRHRQPLQNAECRMQNRDLVVKFDKSERAVTPGQFAVFYLDGECLGGGVIK